MPKQTPLIDTSALETALQAFADERDWNRFHSPKNLAMALTGEVGELVEIFQWLTEEQSRTVADDPATARAVRDELADVALYLIRLCSVLKVDLNEAITQKMQANSKKYPAPNWCRLVRPPCIQVHARRSRTRIVSRLRAPGPCRELPILLPIAGPGCGAAVAARRCSAAWLLVPRNSVLRPRKSLRRCTGFVSLCTGRRRGRLARWRPVFQAPPNWSRRAWDL